MFLTLSEESNRYCHQYNDTKGDDNPVPPDISLEEIYLFLPLILKMGHNQYDILKEYWSRDPICHAPSNLVSCGIIDSFTSSGSYILKTSVMPLTKINKLRTGCENCEEFLLPIC
jgi:hypothetical protein